MSKSTKKSSKSPRPIRYQRNLQIAVIVISVLLVLSMALSLAINL